jgi:hypothetical protein
VAVSRLSTTTQAKFSSSTSTLDFQHTVDTGTDFLLLVVAVEADETINTPDWDRDGTPQTMAFISQTVPAGAGAADVRLNTYGLLNPNEGTDYFDNQFFGYSYKHH